ncbi:hypothetical protein GCM10022256_14740 [Frondihabitans peucedani]|uniref:Uncharacterized protein n=1 Tax=Frondihabitans peucedani TaxID=598626 RepID=A0ABP8E0Y1_9MICO
MRRSGDSVGGSHCGRDGCGGGLRRLPEEDGSRDAERYAEDGSAAGRETVFGHEVLHSCRDGRLRCRPRADVVEGTSLSTHGFCHRYESSRGWMTGKHAHRPEIKPHGT